MKQKKKDDRYRAWTFEIYPESAPSDWIQRVNVLHIPLVVSPLHDKDVYDHDIFDDSGNLIHRRGDLKKAHYHCVIMFEGKKSYEQIKAAITDPLNQPRPEPVHNLRSMIRYLIHIDDPDKYQYPFVDILVFGGADVKSYFDDCSSRYEALHDMCQFCIDNNITEIARFAMVCYEFHREDWYPYLCDNCMFFMSQFLKSYRHNPAQFDDLVTIDVVDSVSESPCTPDSDLPSCSE